MVFKMLITRRRLALSAATIVAFATGGSFLKIQLNKADTKSESNEFFRYLPIPELWDARKLNGKIVLTVQEGETEIVLGVNVPTLGYSSSILGPTIRFQNGDTVNVKITNSLDSETNIHWHGLMIPSESDGGPNNLIKPAQISEFSFHVMQRASTAWYHPLVHGDTGRQVYFGLAGMIIVDDALSANFDLPTRYGLDDLPIILQDLFFNDNGDLLYDNSPDGFRHGLRGNTITVNGIYGPVAEVPKGLVRLRLLNAANARNFRLSFDDGRSMHVIAGDDGFLSAPSAISMLTIAPGERYEILVDFSDGSSTALLAYTDRNGQPSTYLTDELDQISSNANDIIRPVMRFDPADTTPTVAHQIPSKLAGVETVVASSDFRRRVFLMDTMEVKNQHLYGGLQDQQSPTQPAGETQTAVATKTALELGFQMGFNGRAFDSSRIDEEVKLGSKEIWDIRGSEMALPFHIQGASFRILNLDGAPPQAHQSGLKDTVLVNKQAEILVSFDQPTTVGKPFIFYCHILEHEDAGMMGQYLVRV